MRRRRSPEGLAANRSIILRAIPRMNLPLILVTARILENAQAARKHARNRCERRETIEE